MNFGLPNLTKQKKRRSLGRQQNVTQKRIIGTQQNVTTFSQFFLFPAMIGFSLILFYFFMFTAFSQQILGEKLLLVLKLCIKKKKQKDNTRKLCVKP